MIFGVILANEIDTETNISQMPKQFLMLGSKPIIIHTIEKFLLCPRFNAIYVGIHKNWSQYLNDLVNKYNVERNNLVIINGNDSQVETVFNVIKHIKDNYDENESDIVVIHDSTRPFVTTKIIEENIDLALSLGACSTVATSTDAIVFSKDKIITKILDQSSAYKMQTPQSFKINLIYDLYNNLTKDEKKTLTNVSEMCILKNVPIHIIKGEVANIKITTIANYKIANAFLGGNKVD